MKLDFDKTLAVPKLVGSSIIFWDYPNKSYLIELDGYYYAVVYSNGDSIYFSHTNNEYSVSRIYTSDGLTFTFKE